MRDSYGFNFMWNISSCGRLRYVQMAISRHPIWQPLGPSCNIYFELNGAEGSGGAYRIGLEQASIYASIQTFKHELSLRPAGRLKSNLIWNIIRVGDRLHKVLG